MTSTKTRTKTSTPTPNLDALHARHKAGAIIGKDAVLAAMAADVLDVWNAEHNAKRQAEAEAERKAWSSELAEFIADTLATACSPVFPMGTVFTTNPEKVPEGVPAVVVSPASRVEHSGGGLTKGKVSLAFHNVAKPSVGDLTGILDAHSLHKVSGGNYPTHTLSSDGWVLDLPYIARPNTAVLAQQIARSVEAIGISQTGVPNRLPIDVIASAGASEVVSNDGERIVLRGHVFVTNDGSDPEGAAIGYNHDRISDAAKRAVERIASTGGFVANVGKVQSAEVVKTEPHKVGDRHGVGIAFQVTARGRYDA